MSLASEVIVWGVTTSGKNARMGRRTAAHLDYTIQQLAIEHPGAKLHVIQSSYNTGVKQSAGTHDKDKALDVYIDGLSWVDSQKFLRRMGWAAWYRYPPTFSRHIHMISLGGPSDIPVGIYIPGQIRDYYNGRTGLVGHLRDSSWHPDNIDATIFDFEEWENEMKKEELASAPIVMLVGPDDSPKTVPLQSVLRDLEGTQDRHGSRLDDIETKLDDMELKLDAILKAVSG